MPVKVRRSRSVRFASTRGRTKPGWVKLKKEDFPSKGNQERCKSKERKEEQEQKVVGAGDCF